MATFIKKINTFSKFINKTPVQIDYLQNKNKLLKIYKLSIKKTAFENESQQNFFDR